MPISPDKIIENLARAMVADILESCTLDEIDQLIEEMQSRQRRRELH
jgi:Mg/Co/Ni transporter MgtE